MKKITISLMLLFLMSTCLSAQTRIAVYVSGILSENYNTLLGDNLVETFAESNQYIAVNRSAALNSILKKAQSIQENGHIDYTQVVSATKQYGESQLCAVNVIEIDYMYVFRASLLDVLTNTVIKTASAEAPKSEIGYTKILEIAQKLSNRLLPNAQQSNNSNLSSLKTASEIELAKKRVEETRQYDISYAAFKTREKEFSASRNARTNSHPNFDAIQFYYKKYYNTKKVGDAMWVLPAAAAVAGLGIGLTDFIDTKQKLAISFGVIGATILPSIICYSAAAGYRKRAWKEFRKPYDNSIKELKEARKYQRASLELAPTVGYDWAGLSLRLKLN